MTWKKKALIVLTLALLAATLSGWMGTPALGQQPERVRVLIAFNHLPGPAEQALVHRAGGTVRHAYHLVPAIAATLPETAIARLQANPNVLRVEPDLVGRAVDTELDNAWGVTRIGAGAVHSGGNAAVGVKIAIIDSGVNYDHPDLNASYAGGYDFTQGDDDPMDVYGHGTHVAGTACAEDNDNGISEPGLGVVGVAPGCALYSLRVLDDDGSGYASETIAAMQWAVDNDIQVANLSLGWDRDPGTIFKAAFDNAWTAGLVTVAAAGNSGNPPGRGNSVIYPAKYDSVIAVAATDSSDSRASFSSTGDEVELAAPGVSVFSTWNDDTGYYDPQPVCGTDANGEYGCYKYGSGTSMASPHVAGTAALILAANPGWTNDQVRAQLQSTADDLGDAGRDAQYGYGLVDADEAASAVGGLPTASFTYSCTDRACDFDASASYDPDGSIVSYAWDFGDGATSTGQNPSHTYAADGTYTVSLTVTDDSAATDTASQDVTVTSGGSGSATLYVFDIAMSSKTAGPNRSGIAVVTIKDTDGNLVDGATVYGMWSGAYSGSTSGTTGTDGTVRFESGKVRQSNVTFIFAVDNVEKSDYIYDSTRNVETSDSITVQ
jgi:PKD repeat protein